KISKTFNANSAAIVTVTDTVIQTSFIFTVLKLLLEPPAALLCSPVEVFSRADLVGGPGGVDSSEDLGLLRSLFLEDEGVVSLLGTAGTALLLLKLPIMSLQILIFSPPLGAADCGLLPVESEPFKRSLLALPGVVGVGGGGDPNGERGVIGISDSGAGGAFLLADDGGVRCLVDLLRGYGDSFGTVVPDFSGRLDIGFSSNATPFREGGRVTELLVQPSFHASLGPDDMAEQKQSPFFFPITNATFTNQEFASRQGFYSHLCNFMPLADIENTPETLFSQVMNYHRMARFIYSRYNYEGGGGADNITTKSDIPQPNGSITIMWPSGPRVIGLSETEPRFLD
ncbi:hypothetical protein C0J52_12283, partial [Blattella germanica]